jgi:hypothetical protein
MSAFDRLIQQIDQFIRKYYKNELLKGVLLFSGFLFASWLVVSVMEYFGRFSSTVRLMMLISFVVINVSLLIRYFVLPLGKLYQFGARINREQAARIIGSFFPTVSDRLINTLQLNESLNPNDRSFELIRASVAQRSNELSVLPFVDAVRFSDSKRYLKFVIPVVLVFLSVLVLAPALIIDGSSNVVHYNEAQKAPFQFLMPTEKLTILEGESFTARVRLSGEYIPEKVFLITNRGRFQMQRKRKDIFEYKLENVKLSSDFHFESEGYVSSTFKLSVIGKSNLGLLKAHVVFPGYLHRKPADFKNVVDLELPEGSVVNWSVRAKNVKSFRVNWLNETTAFNGNSGFFKKRVRASGVMKLFLSNAVLSSVDTSVVQIKVIKDAYPAILVSELTDSINPAVKLFEGLVSDDYGLSALSFHYAIKKKNGNTINRSFSVKTVKGTADKFVFSVDFSREDLAIDDEIAYYFTVSDNDGVNGHKATVSQVFNYSLPSLSELNEKRDELQEEVQNSLANVLKKTEQFQKDVKRLQKSLLNQSKSDFRNKEQVQQLQLEQQQLQHQLESLQNKLDQSNEEKNELSPEDEELLKQQELIDELLKEVMDDELKKLLDELDQLMQKNDQQELKQTAEELNQNTEDQKKQLDHTLEMLKRLQVNEKIDAIEKELLELAKEQENLKSKTEQNQLSKEELVKQQDELTKKFDELKKDLLELEKLNKELARPMDLGDMDPLKNEIDSDLKEAQDKIGEGKNSKAGQSQKSAAQKMKELSSQLDKQQQESNKKQNEEDMGLIRMLLENLMVLSFDEEHNMQAFNAVKDTDPYYRKLGRRQRSIIDDTKLVEDSLVALAKRQPKIATFIDAELKTIRSNYNLIVNDIDEHRRRDLGVHQQLVMTSINNLALMLNESLQSMQQEAQSKQSGSGSCDNPGGSGKKPSGSQMSSDDMKEMLKKQLDQMKKGPNPGGSKPGDKPGQGSQSGQGMPGLGNKEIAKMAAQQTAIRQRLEQLREEMNKEGQGKGNQLNPLIKELEQQEKDLINKNFSAAMLKRQQDILTRLLESEKALKERGFDEKRESKSGKDHEISNLIRFDEYTRQKLGQVELLRSVDPVLSPYYKSKASEYFNRGF